MQRITPCLWFNDQAENAVQFYTSVFSKSSLGRKARYGKSAAKQSGQPEGSVLTIEFQIEGQSFLALNGGPMFQFTPALSLFVYCETEKEINEKWEKLSRGGEVQMPLDKYPWSEKYGWCRDVYGVGWQLILSPNRQKIAPAFLFVGSLFGKGEEALQFYTSTFPDSKVQSLHKDEATNSVMHSSFTLNGQDFVLMESGMKDHQFTFTHAFSFIISCDSQEEIDQFWDRLIQAGVPEQCGWLRDQFGVSWQVVPTVMNDYMTNPDAAKADRVMHAILSMKKLDLQTIQQAAHS